MNYSPYQHFLTSGVNLSLIALFVLLLLQWTIGIKQQRPPGQRFLPQGWQPWWVKIRTTTPSCTYYFGPFPFRWMAQRHQSGYCEDLAAEQAQGIDVAILRDSPNELTLLEELD